jgi:maleate isomerase
VVADTAAQTALALIVPASNTVMAVDFNRMAGDALEVTTWRLPLASVTRAAEERMLSEELPKCLGEVAPTKPGLVVFGCTSAGSLGGLAHDARVGEGIAQATGAECVTVIGAMVEQLQPLAAQVALFTPYTSDLTRSVAAALEEAGCHVVIANGMGIEDNEVIGRMEPAEIVDFVVPLMEGSNADSVFLSCTNWRAAEAIEVLSQRLGLPVFSSNQVSFAAVERRLSS